MEVFCLLLRCNVQLQYLIHFASNSFPRQMLSASFRNAGCSFGWRIPQNVGHQLIRTKASKPQAAATKPFIYQELFEKDVKVETPYKKLTGTVTEFSYPIISLLLIWSNLRVDLVGQSFVIENDVFNVTRMVDWTVTSLLKVDGIVSHWKMYFFFFPPQNM